MCGHVKQDRHRLLGYSQKVHFYLRACLLIFLIHLRMIYVYMETLELRIA